MKINQKIYVKSGTGWLPQTGKRNVCRWIGSYFILKMCVLVMKGVPKSPRGDIGDSSEFTVHKAFGRYWKITHLTVP